MRIDEPEVQKLWDDAMETCTAQGLTGEELDHILQCALRFLKDNDVTSLPVPGSAADTLKEQMAERLPFNPKLTGTDDG